MFFPLIFRLYFCAEGHQNAQGWSNIKAASCRIVNKSKVIGTGVLCRFFDSIPAKTLEAGGTDSSASDSKDDSQLCILTAQTLIPTALDALHAYFEFHHGSEVFERQVLVNYNEPTVPVTFQSQFIIPTIFLDDEPLSAIQHQ